MDLDGVDLTRCPSRGSSTASASAAGYTGKAALRLSLLAATGWT